VIRYEERVRPLVRISEAVQALEVPGFEILSIGRPEPMTTLEGEHAAQVALEGLLHGTRARAFLGCVFGDDFYSRLLGLSFREGEAQRIADVVARLVRSDVHLLGVRRRRYVCDRPPGWQGVTRGTPFHTYFYPDDYPSDLSELVVCPAIPLEGRDDLIQLFLAAQVGPCTGLELDHLEVPEALASTSGLEGGIWGLHVRHPTRPVRYRDVAILVDTRYLYPLHVDSTRERRDENRRQLRRVALSVQPVPRRGATSAAAAAMSLWSE
jgi:hypothetical protein